MSGLLMGMGASIAVLAAMTLLSRGGTWFRRGGGGWLPSRDGS